MLTGKGNIRDSRANAIEIIENVVAAYLGVGDEPSEVPGGASGEARAVAERAVTGAPMSLDSMRALAEHIEARHRHVGYADYQSWIEAHT